MSPGLMAADVASIVSFEDVSKVYSRIRAVDGLSLELRRGKRWHYSGPTAPPNRLSRRL
jgi:ABC-type sugar transport system ATPase subunit